MRTPTPPRRQWLKQSLPLLAAPVLPLGAAALPALPPGLRLAGSLLTPQLGPGSPAVQALEQRLGLRTEWLPPARLLRSDPTQPLLAFPVHRCLSTEHQWQWLARLTLDELLLWPVADTPLWDEGPLAAQSLRVVALHGALNPGLLPRLPLMRVQGVPSDRSAAAMLQHGRAQAWVTMRSTADTALREGWLRAETMGAPRVLGAASLYLAASLAVPEALVRQLAERSTAESDGLGALA